MNRVEPQLIRELNENLRKQVAPGRAFLLGIVKGAGVAIGATIVAALLIWLLNVIFSSVEGVPLLDAIMNRLQQI